MKGKVAIIGIGCAYPGGLDYAEFWDNIINDKNRSSSDRETRISPIEFDASEFDIYQEEMNELSTEQLYSLVIAKQAMIDAKLFRKNSKKSRKEKTGVIISAAIEIAGCISKIFDFGGTSCSIDSSYGSDLVAVRLAVDELRNGNCDVVLCGGVNCDNGDSLENGVGIIIMKRYADAKKDGDKIYAVIKEISQIKDDTSKISNVNNNDNGMKSLIRTSLALHEKVYMPYTSSDRVKAWIINDRMPIRDTLLSSTGFGGMNYSVVLEEDKSDYEDSYRITKFAIGMMFSATSKLKLISKIKSLLKGLEENKRLWLKDKYRYHSIDKDIYRIAFVAKNDKDVVKKCTEAITLLNDLDEHTWNVNDIIYSEKEIVKDKVTALFPGMGTQNIDMLSDIAIGYPNMRKMITVADNIMLEKKEDPVSELVYPSVLTNEGKNTFVEKLDDVAKKQIVLTTIEAGLYNILSERGFEPDIMIGYGEGELVALWVDGVYDTETLIRIAKERGLYMSKTKEGTTMAMVKADKTQVANYIAKVRNVYIAYENSPCETVISGDEYEINKLYDIMNFDGIEVERMDSAGAYHSPYMVEAASKLKEYLSSQNIKIPSNRVIANFTGDVYNANARDTLVNQIISPVLFATCINKAYEKGARVFVEIGNGDMLSELSKEILKDKECEIISLCSKESDNSMDSLEYAMARLAILGYDIKDDKYRGTFDERLRNKKTKDSYRIEFSSIGTIESFNEDEELVIFDKEVGKMNNTKDVQAINAEVFNKFMDVQTAQLSAVSKMLEVSNAKTENEKKHIIDLVTMFQNNSLEAYNTYFGNSANDMLASNVVWTETAKEVNEPLVEMNTSVKMVEEK